MSEELKAALARIACLEGEIAKRDARIVELEDAAESLRISRDYHHEQEVEYRRRWAGLNAAPVSEAKAQGVVQWPEADEIMQMAFEEGQPADDASGYCFELEEFDLFIERLMSEVARLNAAPVQQVSVPDGWKLVPVNATEAILDVLYSNGMDESDSLLQDIWSAMIAAAPAAPAAGFSPDIQAMVSRFLGWTLPDNFHPDAGVVFTPPPNHHWWPTGTNLLSADQAKAMFEYVLAPSTKEHLDSIRNLKARIADLAERLPYADGQSYYDDKRKIEALTAELFQLESRL